MSQDIPRRVTVDSHVVARLVFEKIFPAMQGEPTDAMVLSLICAAALAMRPGISPEKLQACILDTSGYLITMLQDEVAPKDAN